MTTKGAETPTQVSLKWLSVLPVVEGLSAIVTRILFFRGGQEALSASGQSAAYLVIGGLFLGLLGLVTGVAIWLGRRWGWWLAVYYFLYEGLRGLGGVVSSAVTGSGLGRNLLTLGVGFGIAFFMYTPGWLGWFGVTLRKKWPSALLLSGAAIATILIFLVLAALL